MKILTKVYSPNKNYSGISANVKFKDGVGETDRPQVIDWFREHGYTIESTEPELEPKPELEPELELEMEIEDLEQISLDDIDKTDAEQLKVYAAQEGIDIGMSTSARGILRKITSVKKQEV